MGTNAHYQGRIEDNRFITGQGSYVADLRFADLAHAFIVRSPYAHARIIAIATEDARTAPGVIAVYTAEDLAADGIGDQPCPVKFPRPDGDEAFPAKRRMLARDTIRHLGEPVAMIIAENRAAAIAAGERVNIVAEELDVVTDARTAIGPDAPLIWDEVPDNVAFVLTRGDETAVDTALAASTHIARFEGHVSRVLAHTIETRGVLARVDDDGRLVVHASNQSPFGLRNGLSAILGVPTEKIRVLAGDVGGSFGMKSGAYPEDVLVSFAARKLGRPVRWVADRSEGFLADEHARDIHMRVELGLDSENNFTALKVLYDVNLGAYLTGRSTGMVGNFGGIAGVYRIGAICGTVRGMHTNTQITAPYRGAGRPEATFAVERVVDVAALELGVDPFELRRRNLIPPEAMPHDTGFVFTYDCGEFEENMLAVAEMADRAGFETRRQEALDRGKYRGLGIANPIEVAGGPFVRPGKDYSKLTVTGNGLVTLHTGTMSVGQGMETAFSNLVAERLGVPVDNVVYAQGDTDALPGGRGNGGSSSTPVGASSVSLTIDNLIAKAGTVAAEMLQTGPDNVVFSEGEFAVVGGGSVSLADVAGFASEKHPDGLQAEGEFDPQAVTYPNGCHICEVEIDPVTGEIEIIRYSVCEDIGTILNPTLAEGQMHGGIVQGAGQALHEQAMYDSASGQLQTGSFLDYRMPRAGDFPSFQFRTREVPTKVNPMGAKGIGEAGTVGSMAAAINAVCDALKPLGIRHIEMPASPHRIWTAINEATARSDGGSGQ